MSFVFSTIELPDPKPHEHHADGQPPDDSNRNDGFECDTRVGLDGTTLGIRILRLHGRC